MLFRTNNYKKMPYNPLIKRGCYISLACSIGSISIACGSLLQLQSTTERISIQRGLFLTSLGFLYFISLTDFFNKYLLETQQGIEFRKKYNLMVSDVMDITNKIVSAIQAAFSCLAGFIVCKSSCSKSFLFASHYVLEAYAWFGTAYFMYDIWSMYKVHLATIGDKLKLIKLSSMSQPSSTSSSAKLLSMATEPNMNCISNGLYDKKNHSSIMKIEALKYDYQFYEDYNGGAGDFNGTKTAQTIDFLKYMLNHPVMMIHHIFIGTFGFLVIVYIRGGGDCIYSFIYMMEFSTPFVSLRGILSILGLKDNRIYVFNGIAMLITFFICRIIMWPYVFHWYSLVINKPFMQSILELPKGCKIGILILFLPQIYWFYLMLKGAIKVFFPKSKKSIIEEHATKLQNKSKNNNLSPETPDNPIFSTIFNTNMNNTTSTTSNNSSQSNNLLNDTTDNNTTNDKRKLVQSRSLL